MDNIVMLKGDSFIGIKYLEQTRNAYQRWYVFLEMQTLNLFTLNIDIFLRKACNFWADCISDWATCRIKYSTTNWMCHRSFSEQFISLRNVVTHWATVLSATKESSTEECIFPAWKMSNENNNEAQTLTCQLRNPHITAHFLHRTCSCINIA